MMFYCEQPNCNYKAKQKIHITSHLAFKHSIGVKWFVCKQPNCDYKAKKNSILKDHLAYKHKIGIKWVHCKQPNCNYKAKRTSDINKHLINKHSIGVIWKYCTEPNCDYKAKHNQQLKEHKAYKHSIGVNWVYCDQPKCDYKGKKKNDVKLHKLYVHSIGVKWIECKEPDCEYKGKKQGDIKQHLSHFHDIGDKQCQFCVKNVFNLTTYHDPKTQKTCEICRKCYRKCTGYKTRVEQEMVEYLSANELIKPYIVSKDKIIRGEKCNTRRRPDLHISSTNKLHLISECDEYGHDGYIKSCEQGRIDEILDELPEGRVIIIRWNPDSFKIKGKRVQVSRKIRLKKLADLIIKLSAKTDWKDTENIMVYYMFYSDDSEMLCDRWEKKMIY